MKEGRKGNEKKGRRQEKRSKRKGREEKDRYGGFVSEDGEVLLKT